MNKINPTQLMSAYEATRQFLSEDKSAIEIFHPVKTMFEEKKSRPDASIMVYGVYNAGKSTLINTLLGREEAATDDVPLTDRVTAYQWGQYSIIDTPGVDAPIDHENVTRAQMLKADAVIFVVDPVGTAEEAKTLSVLMDIQQEGKQVFLVFNEKKPISEQDFITLKNQTRERLQNIALERKLDDILEDIPIVRINAKRALSGKLKDQQKLVDLSGYPIFEKQLLEFLASISSDHVYGRLKNELDKFIQEYIAILKSQSQSAIVRQYEKLLLGLSTEKSRLRQDMRSELIRHRDAIHERSKALMRTSPDDFQSQIEGALEKSGATISEILNEKLQIFIGEIQSEIEQLQTDLPNIEVADAYSKPRAPNIMQSVESSSEANPAKSSKLDPLLLKGAVDQLSSLARPEHIVSSLKLVKSALPSLMKGVGAKTMEKWASTVLTKWIPHVGIVITVLSVLSDLFSGDPEEKRLNQQADEQKKARERALQQMEDFSREISSGFEMSMGEIIQNELEKFFADVVAQVESLRQGFSESDRKNSQRIGVLLDIQQLAATA